jgi:hypothetical protein
VTVHLFALTIDKFHYWEKIAKGLKIKFLILILVTLIKTNYFKDNRDIFIGMG